MLLLIVFPNCFPIDAVMFYHFYECPNSYHENSPSVLIHVGLYGLSLEELEGVFWLPSHLGGGFQYSLFQSLFGEDSHFD